MTIERMRDIHAFVHVAEAKSFTAAAERIGLSRSAVGKSVLRLEDRLGRPPAAANDAKRLADRGGCCIS